MGATTVAKLFLRAVRLGRFRELALLARLLSKRDLLRGKAVLPLEVGRVTMPFERLWAFSSGDYYETNVSTWFDRLLGQLDNPVVLDIGANCGYYSLRAATKSRCVYAFEPVTKTFRTLQENIEVNEAGQVVPLKMALSDQVGHQDIYLFEASGNNSLFSRRIDHLAERGREQVAVETLDHLLATGRIEHPDLVKIDVEGAELGVLRGGCRVLSGLPPVLMEFNKRSSEDAGYSRDTLLKELESLGYEVWGLSAKVDDLELYPSYLWEKLEVANVVALRPGWPGRSV